MAVEDEVVQELCARWAGLPAAEARCVRQTAADEAPQCTLGLDCSRLRPSLPLWRALAGQLGARLRSSSTGFWDWWSAPIKVSRSSVPVSPHGMDLRSQPWLGFATLPAGSSWSLRAEAAIASRYRRSATWTNQSTTGCLATRGRCWLSASGGAPFGRGSSRRRLPNQRLQRRANRGWGAGQPRMR